MSRVLAVLRHRTVATLLVIAALLLGWHLAMVVMAPGKIGAELSSAVAAQEDRLRISVTLGFEPERFHMIEMQKYGNVMLVEGRSIHVRGVSAADVQQIAQLYWVRSVEELGR